MSEFDGGRLGDGADFDGLGLGDDDLAGFGPGDDADLDDEALMRRLGALAARFDPVPAEAVAAAQASFGWRLADLDRADLELAQLVYDSAVDDQLLAGVRSGGGPRQLTFEAPGLTVEVDVDHEARRMVGQLVPPGPGRIEVRHPGGSFTVDADARGCFTTPRLPRGPVSLRCQSGAGSGATTTEWVAI